MAKKKPQHHPFARMLVAKVAGPRVSKRKAKRAPDPYKWWLDTMADWRSDEQSRDIQRPPDAIAARLREAEIQLLRLYAKGEQSLPREVAYHLAQGVESLHAWHDITYLLPSRLKISYRKTQAPTVFCTGLIHDAVRYIHAVEEGMIDDPTHQKTVADSYQVARKTVWSWRKKYQEIDLSDLRYRAMDKDAPIAMSEVDYRRLYPGGRQQIGKKIQRAAQRRRYHSPGALITAVMLKSGEEYQKKRLQPKTKKVSVSAVFALTLNPEYW